MREPMLAFVLEVKLFRFT